MINTTIAVDGSGYTTIQFEKGKLRAIHLSLGPNAPITVKEATESSLVVGACSHCWFRVEIEEAGDDYFLGVRVTTDGNSSMNFYPEGLPGKHVNPGTTETLTYNRSKTFKFT